MNTIAVSPRRGPVIPIYGIGWLGQAFPGNITDPAIHKMYEILRARNRALADLLFTRQISEVIQIQGAYNDGAWPGTEAADALSVYNEAAALLGLPDSRIKTGFAAPGAAASGAAGWLQQNWKMAAAIGGGLALVGGALWYRSRRKSR